MYVVSYDIVSDRLRAKVSKVLEEYGIRVQYSVFECRVEERRIRSLYNRLMELMNGEEEGSIRFYPVCANCENKIRTIGQVPEQTEQITQRVIVV